MSKVNFVRVSFIETKCHYCNGTGRAYEKQYHNQFEEVVCPECNKGTRIINKTEIINDYVQYLEQVFENVNNIDKKTIDLGLRILNIDLSDHILEKVLAITKQCILYPETTVKDIAKLATTNKQINK